MTEDPVNGSKQAASLARREKFDSAHESKFANGKADVEGKVPSVDVLEQPEYVGKGDWYHIGFHMTTAVASVPTLGLPYAVSLLGWGGGIVALLAGGLVTLFTSILIASMLGFGGTRHIRYRDLAVAVFGKRGYWAVTPFQMAVCIGSVIANMIVAGQGMKAINTLVTGTTSVTLTEYIIVFGAFNLIVSQCPHFHSLRFVNLIATCCTIGFSIIAVGLSLYAGTTTPAPRDYSLTNDPTDKLFNIFNGLGIMAFAYGNTVIPEIGATARQPIMPTMRGGIIMAFTIILGAYITVSITGYWAFGNSVEAVVLSSLSTPSWAVILAWLFAVIQVTGTTQVYSQPIFEACDKTFGRILAPVWSLRNTLVRLVCRTVFICLCCFIGAMLPFFGDVMGVIGACGYTPMDFILPQFLWIAAYKPKGFRKYLALLIAGIYTVVGFLALVGGVRAIVQNAVTYSLFANL